MYLDALEHAGGGERVWAWAAALSCASTTMIEPIGWPSSSSRAPASFRFWLLFR
jgi:hypothetical protein